MAAGTLAAPGTRYGPCDDACMHRDCAQTRRMAESACVICGMPIGYDTRFYNEHNAMRSGFVHASCLEQQQTEASGDA